VRRHAGSGLAPGPGTLRIVNLSDAGSAAWALSACGPRLRARLGSVRAGACLDGHYLSRGGVFRGSSCAQSLRECPPSYMRLTVAISRVFDRLGFGLVAPSGPKPTWPQKKDMRNHGKGHRDRSRHHQFVRLPLWMAKQLKSSKTPRHADDPVDRRFSDDGERPRRPAGQASRR